MIGPGRQLVDAMVRAPAAIARVPRTAWAWLVVYLLACSAVLGGFGWVMAAYQDSLRDWALAYLVPEDWRFAARHGVDLFFRAQLELVLVNATVMGGLVLIAITLFPLKEKVSAVYEVDGALTDRPMGEFPLWFQAWEEIKLFLLFIAAQGSIFWIGYPPSPTRKYLAVALGFGFLFFSYAIDFISPVFQRHEGRYSRILKLLWAHPLMSFGFGAVFAAPPLIVGVLWSIHPEWPFGTAVFWLLGAEVLSIAWAVIGGTWLGARMLPRFEQTRRSSLPVRVFAWLAFLGVIGANGYVFGSVGLALHHKSQLLKCHYSVDIGSFGVDRPSLTRALLDDSLEVGVHFDVRIENPTVFDVRIEDNRIELRHDGAGFATTRLSPADVPAGATVTQRVAVNIELSPRVIADKNLELIDIDRWDITLYLRVAEHFELPVYLLTADRE